MPDPTASTDVDRADDDDAPMRLGGMALANGLLVHGATSWAAAVRARDGGIRVAGGVKPGLGTRLDGVPLVRGVVKMGELLALLPVVRRALPEARLPFEQPTMLVASVATAAASAGARRSTRLSPAATEALVTAMAALPAVMLLRSGRLANYHGAEHKVIGAYEHGTEAAAEAKEHERCGSHLVGPLVGATAIANALVSRVPREKQGPARAAASLAATGVAIEVFGWMTRNRGRRLERILSRPGTELQRVLGTREPSADELAVARAALDRLLALEGRAPAPAA